MNIKISLENPNFIFKILLFLIKVIAHLRFFIVIHINFFYNSSFTRLNDWLNICDFFKFYHHRIELFSLSWHFSEFFLNIKLPRIWPFFSNSFDYWYKSLDTKFNRVNLYILSNLEIIISLYYDLLHILLYSWKWCEKSAFLQK